MPIDGPALAEDGRQSGEELAMDDEPIAWLYTELDHEVAVLELQAREVVQVLVGVCGGELGEAAERACGDVVDHLCSRWWMVDDCM